MSLRLRLACMLLSAVGTLTGCSFFRPDLVAQEQLVAVPRIERLAVLPFRQGAALARSLEAAPPENRIDASDAAALATRLMTEAVAERGVDVIAAHDVLIALERSPHWETGPLRPELLALVVAADLDVDALVVGELRVYRERAGSAYGSLSPASVQMTVTLYAAPSGDKLWVGSFDRTQAGITENLFEALRYPGGGTRFLTAAELARFGAERLAAEMPLGRR